MRSTTGCVWPSSSIPRLTRSFCPTSDLITYDMPVNEKVYIHEFIDIIGHNRGRYMYHMTANWSPAGQEDRHQLCYGVWGVVGSTGRWPQVVNIWEEDGFDGLA